MFPIPPNERERLEAVRRLQIIGSAPEAEFDAVCRTARALFDLPIALVTLIEDECIWLKARSGIEEREVPRRVAFCSHALLSDEPLVVSDTSLDPRFADNPLVGGPTGMRFYAGVPLILEPGLRVGTVCVIDRRPREFSADQVRQLQDLALIVVAQLRLRHSEVMGRTTQAALTESEARYRFLADSLPQMVWIIRGADGEALYMNRPFRDYYGYLQADMGEREARHHPDDAARIKAAWAAAAQEAQAFEVEGRLRRHDGTYRWHKLVVIPVWRDAGIVEWFCTALDIDALVTANESLRQTSEMLHLAQDAAGAGLWEWNLASNRARLSGRSAALQGFAPAESDEEIEVTAAQWTANLHPDDAKSVGSQLPRAMEAPGAFSAEYRVRAGDGASDYRWIQSFGRVLAGPDGRPDRVVGLDLDVTDRKRVETAIEQARQEAERASAAKTEFLATMSHEIRTPLNGILGYADLLLDDRVLGPDQRLQVARIQGAGNALLTVVNDVLDFAKVEAGQIELDAAPFPLRGLVDNAVAIVAGLAEKKGLALRVRFGGTCPDLLLGDRDRLQQVLLNLLNNAVKFTPEGSVTLDVGCEPARTPTGEAACAVSLAVTDTGIGIPEDRRDRLFLRFSQVDASINRQYGGSGLGLAISQHLVALMGGRIEVESLPGRGSTFRLRVVLPLTRARAETPSPIDAAPAASRRQGRILVVDDVAINRDIAQAVLRSAGHAVDTASGGPEAVMAVQAASYDLILMDVQMPEMDGMAATRHIRALGGPAAATPIIALTANVLPHQVTAFREAGMNGHVGKPFKREELFAAVDAWIGAGEAAA
ncbi:GAF domain-containing hybrid sensor histidine kinase/response regulator [Methylobacterium iners]|uniref:histidine kinase n=1 Tax=Methylobacterium iners TaxID=418707 RepID=A0ABQ4RZ43_9HYPH|nr:GAF domain-containing hybrid sensor histidine kinase/response regulator [Methylobacterium iners]GJD95479.1 Sensor histidine kinase RcsC [Methylobacterium iners]